MCVEDSLETVVLYFYINFERDFDTNCQRKLKLEKDL